MGMLDGKVALISGTGGGQGRAAALIFAREGAIVVGCDFNAETAEETLDLVKAAGGEMISVHPCDLTTPAGAKDWVESAIQAFGKIDILYNNAAALKIYGPFAESTLEDWNNNLLYELTIVYISTHAAWPHLIRNGGTVINIAALAAHLEVFPSRSAGHAAAKAGVVAFTRMLSSEGAAHGVRALSISPGLIRTAATEHYWRDDPRERQKKALFFGKIPSDRAGSCEEVAELAAFLASDRAAYINSTDIIIDGGLKGSSFGSYDQLPSGSGAESLNTLK
jgi:meso-butanediol dehydrogenase/(S,S)-butanediol dehydrogenase/diacetyl reductase